MFRVDVTPRVWERLLAIRAGQGCACCGRWTAGERAALDLYSPLARRDLHPVTVAQIGQSLDGRVATATGDARDVSGPDGLEHLHRMRALVDGVLIGVRTALHDQPRLTVRLCPGSNPARIVVDPRGRLPDDAALFHADGARRIVVQGVPKPRPQGVEVITLPMAHGWLDPSQILTARRARDVRTLLLEGGGDHDCPVLGDRSSEPTAGRCIASAYRGRAARLDLAKPGDPIVRCLASGNTRLCAWARSGVRLRADG